MAQPHKSGDFIPKTFALTESQIKYLSLWSDQLTIAQGRMQLANTKINEYIGVEVLPKVFPDFNPDTQGGFFDLVKKTITITISQK